MTDDCNYKAIEMARRLVADRYFHEYHINAIMDGSWDNGSLVQDELQRILKDHKTVEDFTDE